MTALRLVPLDEKRVALRGIDPLTAHCLFELPEILAARERPEVRGRFFPDLLPGDEEANADWHEVIDPELHHLFVGAEETVTRDLTGLDNGQVAIALEHVAAWMSALNQARLVLGELHHITEQDAEAAEFDLTQPRDQARLRLEVLSGLLELFVEFASGDGKAEAPA